MSPDVANELLLQITEDGIRAAAVRLAAGTDDPVTELLRRIRRRLGLPDDRAAGTEAVASALRKKFYQGADLSEVEMVLWIVEAAFTGQLKAPPSAGSERGLRPYLESLLTHINELAREKEDADEKSARALAEARDQARRDEEARVKARDQARRAEEAAAARMRLERELAEKFGPAAADARR